ncbi:MAG: hypothetical protein ACR2OB_11555 [Solirubrobacteraceae bacterium]
MRRRRRPAQELRAAIDGLPLEVRQAVLEGIQHQRIIAGAHVDGAGGVCPMAAADVRWRSIGAASVQRAQAAARAWDRYAQATSGWHAASDRQLLALRAMLEASILEQFPLTTSPLSEAERTTSPPEAILEDERAVVRTAPADSRQAVRARLASRPLAPRPRADAGDRDRTSELRHSNGWSWLRLFRNYDDYEEALRSLSELEFREAVAERGEALAERREALRV